MVGKQQRRRAKKENLFILLDLLLSNADVLLNQIYDFVNFMMQYLNTEDYKIVCMVDTDTRPPRATPCRTPTVIKDSQAKT